VWYRGKKKESKRRRTVKEADLTVLEKMRDI
jgi:hypothetical protein